MPNPKLFAVYLGGRAPKCNIELHDVVFVAGESIDALYETLMDKWFGDPLRVHIDSWVELWVIDGYQIELRQEQAAQEKKLYFINLGAYRPGEFTELHANAFVVAENERVVKQRAKRELLHGTQQVHTDDLYDLDDCLELSKVDGFHIHLSATDEVQPFLPTNAYHVIPRAIIKAYAARHGLST